MLVQTATVVGILIIIMKCIFFQHYRLVIVGHSLGGGVASILAILLEEYFPDLICYAYSPPGCIFRSVLPTSVLFGRHFFAFSPCSFPLVQYSKKFITSVVIGNDMVPRYIYTYHTAKI